MKKYVFYLLSSAFLFSSGFSFYSCNDDEPSPPAPEPHVGVKSYTVNVVDETGTATSADVVISKNGVDMSPVSVTGSYTYTVTNDPSGTQYVFKASRSGYVSSKPKTEQLTYTNASDEFSSTVKLLIVKKGDPITINPAVDNTFELPSSSSAGSKVKVTIPAGALGSTPITLTPTVIPNAASQGRLEAESPNGNLALQIIDFESSWVGNFAGGKKVDFTFPLTQNVVDMAVNNGLKLVFTSNSSGSTESYPITVNAAAKTGTVSIPHFSQWYLALANQIQVNTTEVKETVAVGGCGLSATGTFSKTNLPVPSFYKALFPSLTLPNLSGSYTAATAVDGNFWRLSALYKKVTLSFSGDGLQAPSFPFYDQESLKFVPELFDCVTHIGGGGQ